MNVGVSFEYDKPRQGSSQRYPKYSHECYREVFEKAIGNTTQRILFKVKGEYNRCYDKKQLRI